MLCKICGKTMRVIDEHYDSGCHYALMDYACDTLGCEGGYSEICGEYDDGHELYDDDGTDEGEYESYNDYDPNDFESDQFDYNDALRQAGFKLVLGRWETSDYTLTLKEKIQTVLYALKKRIYPIYVSARYRLDAEYRRAIDEITF